LRPKETNTEKGPPKKILSRNKVNEAVVTKTLVEKKFAQTKIVETQSTQTKKTENTKAQSSNREAKKTVGGFSLENEINKSKSSG
jgi:hypothetical protein